MDQCVAGVDALGFERLLRDVRGGDQPAWDQLWRCCAPMVSELSARRFPWELKTQSSPDDVAQETYAEALARFAAFDGTSLPSFLAWVRTIFDRTLIKLCRVYLVYFKRRPCREVRLDDERNVGVRERLKAATPAPSQRLEDQEEGERRARAMESLPENYRQAFELHYQEELSFEAIGARLGCGEGAARHYCRRAREMLRRALADDDGA